MSYTNYNEDETSSSLTPTTIKMRLLLQNLWIWEKGWDDQLENEEIKSWKKIIADMKELSTISVPRLLDGETSQLLFL